MFTIIFWKDKKCYPLRNEDNTILEITDLKEAVNLADMLEEHNNTIKCRVISLACVKMDAYTDSRFSSITTRTDCQTDCPEIKGISEYEDVTEAVIPPYSFD